MNSKDSEVTGLKLRGVFCPKFSLLPNGETVRQMRKHFWRCKNDTDLLYHHAAYGEAGTLPPRGGGGKKVGTCQISVFVFCLPVTLFER